MRSGAINLGNPVSSSPLNRGLVGWWLALPQRMGGLRFLDLCQPGNHGTLTNGPTWSSAAGRPGGFGSLSFDGINDYVTIPAISLTNTHTVSAWVRLDAAGSYPMILTSAAGPDLRFFVANRYPMYGANTVYAVAATLGEWNHYLATSNGTNTALYLNGTSVATSVVDGTTRSGTINIGRRSDGFYLTGGIDDVRLWDRTLSADEARAAYNDSRTGYPQTLNRLPMRVYGTAGGGGGGFQSAWASGSNVMIQPWVAV